jgi:hypothetical protein
VTPLSWCIVISTAANVSTAAMVAWFLMTQPSVHVSGGVFVRGSVQVDGGTIDVKQADKDTIQKVEICTQTSELSTFPLPSFSDSKQSGPQYVPVIHCASIDQSSQFGNPPLRSYGLSVVPARN